MKQQIDFFLLWMYLSLCLVISGASVGCATAKKGNVSPEGTPAFAQEVIMKTGTIYTMGASTVAPDILYAGTQQGLFTSEDAGRTWREVAIENQSQPVFAVAVIPGTDNVLFAGTRTGLWKTENRGKSWLKVVSDGLPEEHMPLSLAFCAKTPHDAYMGIARHGVFRSVDGGNSWTAVNTGLPMALNKNRIAPVKSLLVDPFDGNTAYIGTELSGLYKTTNGGKTWQSINKGLPQLHTQRTYPPRLAMSTDGVSLYAAIGIAVHSHLVRTALYHSVDSGQSWHVVETSLPPNLRVISLDVDPADSRTVSLSTHQGDFTVSHATAFTRK